jgi:AcrR family transcriptional regulator/DNA-binding MarR family transcriptional regulator
MAEEAAIRGVSSVTVARVIARAGVSRRLFYELFDDIEDCFLATFDWGVEQARTVVVEAYAAEESWCEAIRAGLAALLRFFDEQPLLAQLCVVHAAGGGPRVLERRSGVISELCAVVDRGRLEPSARQVVGPVVAEGTVGAVLAVLYTRLLSRAEDGRAGGTGVGAHRGESGGRKARKETQQPLIELHGQLMSLIVLPYLGAAAAGRQLRKPAPAPLRQPEPEMVRLSRSSSSSSSSSSEDLAARMTYRTVRVLMAIAELPAGSNREVAERAGIVDQGQISKILTRLEYQGLVVNRGGEGPGRGTPNSWWLTERGEALALELREKPSGEKPSGKKPSGDPPSKSGRGSASPRRST